MRGEKGIRSMRRPSGARIALPLFLLMFVFFLCSLFRMAALLKDQEHMFFSDIKEIADTMRAVTFRGDMVKHLLFSATTSPLVLLIKTLTPLGEDRAILVVIALFAAMNVAAVFLILRRFLEDEKLSLLFSLLFGFSFTNLVHYSTPETYVVTVFVLLVYFYLLVRFQDRLTWKRTALIFLVTALAPLYNPPLVMLLIPSAYFYFRHFKRKVFLAVLSAHVLFVAGVVSVPYILIPAFVLPHTKWAPLYDIKYPVEFMKIWASFSHFTSLKDIANGAGNFLFFSVISPFRELKPPADFLADFLGYFRSVLGAVSLAAYAGLLGLAGFRVFRERNRLVEASLLLLLVMILFHIFFFPGGALLYSTQAVFPLVLVFSWAVKGVVFKGRSVLLILFLAAAAANNLLCLFGPLVLTK